MCGQSPKSYDLGYILLLLHYKVVTICTPRRNPWRDRWKISIFARTLLGVRLRVIAPWCFCLPRQLSGRRQTLYYVCTCKCTNVYVYVIMYMCSTTNNGQAKINSISPVLFCACVWVCMLGGAKMEHVIIIVAYYSHYIFIRIR